MNKVCKKTSFLWFFARLFVEVKYEIQGNKVMLIDGKERDTLTLSTDGKKLSGIYGKDTKYTLNRTK